MSTEFAADVLIVGAGASGLTLAIDLARRGVSFRLIDKMSEPFRGSRGKGIQPRTQEVFEDLGILDRIVATGGIFPPVRDYRADGTYTDSTSRESETPTPAEPYHLHLMVPQFATERVMRERLAELGHAAEYGCELVGFEQDESGVTARLQRLGAVEELRVRYLAGTDGGRSFVRHALNIGFPGKTLGVRSIVADVTLTGLGRDAWHRYLERSTAEMIWFCPLAGTDLFQLQAPIPLEGDVDLSAEGLTRLTKERVSHADIQILGVSWASAFNMNARLADRYRVGRAFIVGDAAHAHPPTGGQGLNTSVQDAYNLGWKLQAVLLGAPDKLLDTYEEERRPIAAGMLGLATNLLDVAKRGPMGRAGREVEQLDLGYLGASLALETPARDGGGVRAGARAPDAPLRGAGGQTRRLFDFFRGPHWTLLVYEGERAPVAARDHLRIHLIGKGHELVDDGEHFLAAYGVAAGTCVLVRPDGYVGAIVGGDDFEALEGYLGDVGAGARG